MRGILASLMVPALVIVPWVACLPSEPAIAPWDGSAGDGGPGDGGIDSGGPDGEEDCDLNEPFARHTLLFTQQTPGERRGAFLLPDELTLYYSYDPDPAAGGRQWKLHTVTRARIDDQFEAWKSMEVHAPPGAEGGYRDPTLSPDERLIVFSMAGKNSGDPDVLYYATRDASTPDASTPTFGPPVRVTTAINQYSVRNPFLHTVADGGLDLWFSRKPDASARYQIYRARLNGSKLHEATSVRSVENRDLPELNDYQVHPVLRADGLEIFFSQQDQSSAKGDIWSSRRATPDVPFYTAGPVDGLLAPAQTNEEPNWLSPNGCRLYFHTSQGTDSGLADLFVAERPPRQK